MSRTFTPADLFGLEAAADPQISPDGSRIVYVRKTGDITRLLTMSIADLLDDWFESPQIKGALAVNGVIGTWAGPYEPGTAYVMAHHSIGDVGDGQTWSFVDPVFDETIVAANADESAGGDDEEIDDERGHEAAPSQAMLDL